jgi:hypothetical protein
LKDLWITPQAGEKKPRQQEPNGKRFTGFMDYAQREKKFIRFMDYTQREIRKIES